MNNIILNKKDLNILRYILKYSSSLKEKIDNKSIPLTQQDINEFCSKVGVNPKYL